MESKAIQSPQATRRDLRPSSPAINRPGSSLYRNRPQHIKKVIENFLALTGEEAINRDAVFFLDAFEQNQTPSSRDYKDFLGQPEFALTAQNVAHFLTLHKNELSSLPCSEANLIAAANIILRKQHGEGNGIVKIREGEDYHFELKDTPKDFDSTWIPSHSNLIPLRQDTPFHVGDAEGSAPKPSKGKEKERPARQDTEGDDGLTQRSQSLPSFSTMLPYEEIQEKINLLVAFDLAIHSAEQKHPYIKKQREHLFKDISKLLRDRPPEIIDIIFTKVRKEFKDEKIEGDERLELLDKIQQGMQRTESVLGRRSREAPLEAESVAKYHRTPQYPHSGGSRGGR